MSSGTDRNLHVPIYPFLHELSVTYILSVFSAVRRHSVLVICLQAQTVTYTCLFTLSFTNFQCHTDFLSSALYGGILSWQYIFRHRQLPTHAYLPFPSQIFSVIQTFCLQRCTETFCLGNMSSGTDSNLHMPIYPRKWFRDICLQCHSVLAICLQAQTGTYTCLFTLSFMNCQCHTDFLSSALYGGILSWQYVFRHRQEPTHAYLPYPSRIVSVIQIFCLQRCTEAFCLGNISSGTESNLHMPIYPFLH